MEMPDLESAQVDPKRFVPLVNGEGLRQLSSGGLKTMASFAYFVAALQVRLRGEPSLLPRFMMIDSPRKNFGKNPVDEASMARFYRTLATLARMSSASEFQVIVGDNDSPSQERDQFGLIELSSEHRGVDIELLTKGPREHEDA